MEKQFVDGLYLNKLSDKAPDFIKASVSIHVDKMIAWLEKNRLLVNEKGYINLKGLESKEGKPYFEVDTWSPTGNKPKAPKVPEYAEEEINPDDIPF